MTLKIDMFGGNCPVQAEGTLNGVPFYFRARGEHWSFSVGADAVGDPDWCITVKWGDGPFAAGWMEKDEARRIIDWCATTYAEQTSIDRRLDGTIRDETANKIK